MIKLPVIGFQGLVGDGCLGLFCTAGLLEMDVRGWLDPIDVGSCEQVSENITREFPR